MEWELGGVVLKELSFPASQSGPKRLGFFSPLHCKFSASAWQKGDLIQPILMTLKYKYAGLTILVTKDI